MSPLPISYVEDAWASVTLSVTYDVSHRPQTWRNLAWHIGVRRVVAGDVLGLVFACQ